MLIYHDEYLKLDSDTFERCFAYRELFKHQLSEHDIHLIERASEYSHPVGTDRFRQEIEGKYGIDLGQAGRGRPKKVVD